MMDPIQVAACAEELQKLAQGLDPQLLTALLGAGVGGYAGYKATHDPRNQVRNAILSALAGGGLGWGAGKMLFPGSQGGPEAPAAGPVKAPVPDYLSELDKAQQQAAMEVTRNVDDVRDAQNQLRNYLARAR